MLLSLLAQTICIRTLCSVCVSPCHGLSGALLITECNCLPSLLSCLPILAPCNLNAASCDETSVSFGSIRLSGTVAEKNECHALQRAGRANLPNQHRPPGFLIVLCHRMHTLLFTKGPEMLNAAARGEMSAHFLSSSVGVDVTRTRTRHETRPAESSPCAPRRLAKSSWLMLGKEAGVALSNDARLMTRPLLQSESEDLAMQSRRAAA